MNANDGVSTLDITTLVIALVGAVTGIASLIWTVASHVLSGARVRVELIVGWWAGGSLMSLPWANFNPNEPPPFSGVEPTHALVGVQVRNVGRLPCSVQGWTISIDNGVALTGVQLPMNASLPHRLEAGDEKVWFAELHSVAAMIAATEGASIPSTAIFGTGATR